MNPESSSTQVQTPQITCTKPFYKLEEELLKQSEPIEDWFKAQWQETPPPVYGSVDLRNAGFKCAPIDMNLFPAGFNNLNPDFLPVAVTAAKQFFKKMIEAHGLSPDGALKLLIIPETHTRNLPYWENVKTLANILTQAGVDIRFGYLNSASATTVNSQNMQVSAGETIKLEPLMRTNDELHVDQFKPDLILLNNDLSSGIPPILQDLKQILLPPAALGWSQRLKSKHFQDYAKVTRAFAETFNFDAWLLTPLFRHCGKVDFLQQSGLECVITNAEMLFQQIQKKYQEYNIQQQPFIIVKADSGTYGMAVMTVRHVDELKKLNRKQRTKMSAIKGGQPVERVIIQEGIYTFETVGKDNLVAEPVIYLWGEQVIGGFYRVHESRGIDESLNAPGMQFEPLAFKQTCHQPNTNKNPEALQNQFYIYGIIARLSMLAAAYEIKESK